MSPTIKIEQSTATLPTDLEDLQRDAASEGYRFIERLVREWNDGTKRFNGPGERLLHARVSGQLAGIGGITIDPYEADALRMRRFYVRPGFRRYGVARALAYALLDSTGTGHCRVNVNAATELAPAFWENLGFRRVVAARHTHVLDPDSDRTRLV
ncbi:GNAT family N-acetyltransferase [Actibacterium ureilyticum]|uniref:GNAT family N-acetyltransferase n=1 Tax=Actibacterium ureilyticum TaxID=1590614 RepID=UPI000BAAC489|nr:GNAT family N-acetyltransferase [Actibacterium ureilyticum]